MAKKPSSPKPTPKTIRFELFIQLTVSAEGDEDDHITLLQKYCSPIAGNIDASIIFTISSQLMIMKLRIIRV